MAMDNKPRNRKRRKVCAFCVDKVEQIDYKDAAKLKRYLSERSKIHLRHAPAPADRRHQARPSRGPAALRHRLNAVKPRLLGAGAFCVWIRACGFWSEAL